jgi:hypothetical protein
MYTVRYNGPFGFIKPWTAVRDELTYSQTFLTPSIIEGMRQKLGVSNILRHRLRHCGIDSQLERTQSAGWTIGKRQASRSLSILTRGVMLQPELTLAFSSREDAVKAAAQHLCLCRNEDILLPRHTIAEISESGFDHLPGVELRFGESAESFLVGFNRFADAAPMYGYLQIIDEAEA